MTSGIVRTVLITTVALLMPMQISKSRSVDEEIRRLNADEVEALLNHNIKRLEYLWSNDLVVTNPLNQFVNKEKVIELVRSGTLAFVSYDREIEYIRTYNDTVVVTGSESVVWAGKMPNAGKTSQLRFTAVWLRQDGRWQEVARHANIVTQ
ncbi:MAG TPA: nuclear transport factor 2 family protein [Pyrinomonadaceae bacterium]